MKTKFIFTEDERKETLRVIDLLREKTKDFLLPDDEMRIRTHLDFAIKNNEVERDIFGLNPILLQLQTALIAVEEIGLKRDSVLAILLYGRVLKGHDSVEDIQNVYGGSVGAIINGIAKIQSLYEKTPVIETENFRNLLLSFAEDMRVILIMIASRVNLMRTIRSVDKNSDTSSADDLYTSAVNHVSQEASYLYAPLAHKLGLYRLKSELEDLSLKHLEPEAYYHIKDKLNATKQARDQYIAQFIVPISEKLKQQGLRFHVKGRTKSIHSIWQKMKKQKCPFEGVYDLFAIRIILEEPSNTTPPSDNGRAPWEHASCWQAYSIVTDMYQPNPKRLRDWLSVPKSNGYESLHITVLGPEQKWVEVQIRTERMDDIAEHGLAAHWRYKGVKATQGGMDEWLASIRASLENGDDLEVMDQFKTTLYEKEVYVFTPKGDIYKFRSGATVLDFAYHIHSKIGNTCTGARINGKVVNMRQVLASGDTVQIITSVQQRPKREWLQIVKTSRAKSKIRLALKETQLKENALVKEMLERRFRNRKMEMEDSIMQTLIKRMGYKEVSEFYHRVGNGDIDIQTVIEKYLEIKSPQQNEQTETERRSASDFVLREPRAVDVNAHFQAQETQRQKNDVLVIDKSMSGLDYSLAQCCRPIYGDDVFGFVTVSGGIKIHRCDCPNATELRSRFGYRIVEAKWSGKGEGQYDITLRVIGNDDIGIVSNVTSIISKEERINMRSISIDSRDGLFSGNLVVQIDDTSRLEQLIRKLRTVKGVKQVTRI